MNTEYLRNIFFLAAFYGVFGLCLGGSVISMIEVIYFFTLRFYGRFEEMDRRHNNMDQPNLTEVHRKRIHQVVYNHQQLRGIRVNANIDYWSVRPYGYANYNHF